MKTAIRTLFITLWAAVSASSASLAYSAFQSERDTRTLWAWLTAAGLLFLSATWLAGIVLFSQRRDPAAPER